jgi:hypothetical protein
METLKSYIFYLKQTEISIIDPLLTYDKRWKGCENQIV